MLCFVRSKRVSVYLWIRLLLHVMIYYPLPLVAAGTVLTTAVCLSVYLPGYERDKSKRRG